MFSEKRITQKTKTKEKTKKGGKMVVFFFFYGPKERGLFIEPCFVVVVFCLYYGPLDCTEKYLVQIFGPVTNHCLTTVGYLSRLEVTGQFFWL